MTGVVFVSTKRNQKEEEDAKMSRIYERERKKSLSVCFLFLFESELLSIMTLTVVSWMIHEEDDVRVNFRKNCLLSLDPLRVWAKS